jgi:hypothetical protein
MRIYKTINLYGCKTWSLTLREKHRLRVFENKVLRRIFVPKRDEVTGGWRGLHNEELRDAGHVARMWEKRNAYRLLVGKPEGKGPLGRPRRSRLVDNIKMDLLEISLGRCGLDWSSSG